MVVFLLEHFPSKSFLQFGHRYFSFVELKGVRHYVQLPACELFGHSVRTCEEVLSGGSLAQTEHDFGLVGQAEVIWKLQNEAKAFLGEGPVNNSAAV